MEISAMTRKRSDFFSCLFHFVILGTRRRGPVMKSWVLGASAAFIAASIAASAPANGGLVTYDVNLTFNAGDTPFSANGVSGMISGAGTIQGTFTVDSLTNVIETVSITAQSGPTLIADYTLGPGYSGLGFGYNLGYTDASFSEPGYEKPDFEALFFYPSGSVVYTGDDVFGSKIEFYNGQGQRIAEDQLSGTILPAASVPEPATWAMLLVGLGGLAVMRVTRPGDFPR
jgi:PEP-CTERM motif